MDVTPMHYFSFYKSVNEPGCVVIYWPIYFSLFIKISPAGAVRLSGPRPDS